MDWNRTESSLGNIRIEYASTMKKNHSNFELLILRHAKSSWNNTQLRDYDRPLNKRGKRDAPLMGQWMKEQGLIPDYILSSPAKRAEMTLKAVTPMLGLSLDLIAWEPAIYGASHRTLLRILRTCPDDAKRILLVGHNPGLENLVMDLLGPHDAPELSYDFLKTATLVHLKIKTPWSEIVPKEAEFISITRPKSLRQ